ncbi:MAG: hypothetical protein FJ308_23945, partial [Planctomycetes bacterium]|nr:hypothetical protein [Planctomycetota bacterium]
MKSEGIWKSLGHRHVVWELLRYYLSFARSSKQQSAWLDQLRMYNAVETDSDRLPIGKESVDLLVQYLNVREDLFNTAFGNLRTEEEAQAFCEFNRIQFGVTATKSKEHHQASKALVATVASIARDACKDHRFTLDPNPQKRCIWCNDRGLHVSARNLDGAIPSTSNPSVVWEIKEYWGKTSGGSKMSDAVYECNLVGRELRDYEAESGITVVHIVFVDGKEQWTARQSDLKRFIDLTYQGLIDVLFVGKEVEFGWRPELDR